MNKEDLYYTFALTGMGASVWGAIAMSMSLLVLGFCLLCCSQMAWFSQR